MQRILLVIVLALALGVAGLWYAKKAGWLLEPLPSDPPTAEELRRMDEVDRASATQAENPVPGAGVRPKGSTPPPAAETSTTTGTSTFGEASDDADTATSARTTSD